MARGKAMTVLVTSTQEGRLEVRAQVNPTFSSSKENT
jgi:hypothetical protein